LFRPACTLASVTGGLSQGSPWGSSTLRQYAIVAGMDFIEAEFDNGVLRPMRRLPLRPGERVGIAVVRHPDRARWDLDRLSKGSSDDQKLAEEGLADWAAALDREDRR
jgi:predicted DNA-binding antitoxin AbrB/MazE fold protein